MCLELNGKDVQSIVNKIPKKEPIVVDLKAIFIVLLPKFDVCYPIQTFHILQIVAFYRATNGKILTKPPLINTADFFILWVLDTYGLPKKISS